jgi:hypothetical protein
MDHGYTYTTLTGRPGEEMRVDTTFYLDETAYIRVVAAGTDRAFLSIDQGAVRVTISARPDVQLTDQDVNLVRCLAEESARLLAEVERIHTEQSHHADRPEDADTAA